MRDFVASIAIRAVADRSLGKTAALTQKSFDRLGNAGEKAALKSVKGTARLGAALKRTRRTVEDGARAQDSLARSTRRSGDAMDRAGRKADRLRGRLGRLITKGREARGMLAGGGGLGLGGLGAGVGAGAAAYKGFGKALRFEEAGVRLSTVINADDRGAALGKALRSARDFGRRNLTSETEILNIQYALNSAGMEAGLARDGAGVVAKVATVTGGTAERTAEVVATTFNNLGDSLEGTAAERMGRIGDLLTKTQFKFQIRNFDQLGESMKEASSAIARFNVPLEQGLTLVGALNNAGLEGGQGGTAFNATLCQIGKASDYLGTEIVRDQNGALDVIGTLEQIKAAFDDYEIDERNALIQKLFGDEGAKGLVPLMKDLDALRQAQAEVTAGSNGLVGESYERFLKSTSGQITLFTNNINSLGASLAGTLFPTINAVLTPVTDLVRLTAELSDQFPVLGQAVTVAAVGFAALKAVGIMRGVGGLLSAGRALGAAAKSGRGAAGIVPVRVTNAAGAFGGGGSGKAGRAGRFGRAASMLGRTGALAAVGGALTIGSALAAGDTEGAVAATGGTAGALAGAAAGAAIGSVVPVIGTAIGGILGSIVGGMGGQWLGEEAAALLGLGKDTDTPVERAEDRRAEHHDERDHGTAPSATHVGVTNHITVTATPEMDERRLAEAVADEISRQSRGALFDEPD